jgi:hypothetical protein
MPSQSNGPHQPVSITPGYGDRQCDRDDQSQSIPSYRGDAGSDSVNVMKKGTIRVLIRLTSADEVEFPASRISFADNELVVWNEGAELARFTASDVQTMDFGPAVSSFSIDEVRATHRNAYAKWTAEEDALLLDLARKSTNVIDIAALFGRQESAIESRLARLSLQLLSERAADNPTS